MTDMQKAGFLTVVTPGIYGSPYLGYRQKNTPSTGAWPLKADSVSTTVSGDTVVTNVYPSYNNVTRADFTWTLPSQDLVDVFPLPIYMFSFRARYANLDPYFLNNVSSCNKTIGVHVCGGPMFEAPLTLVNSQSAAFYSLLTFPSWGSFGSANALCGLAVDRPCLTPAVVKQLNGLSGRVTMLQASPPDAQTILNSLNSNTMPSVVGVRIGQPVELVVAARALDPTDAGRLLLQARRHTAASLHARISAVWGSGRRRGLARVGSRSGAISDRSPELR